MTESALCFGWPTSKSPTTVEVALGLRAATRSRRPVFCASHLRQQAVFSLSSLDKTSGCIHRHSYACKTPSSSLVALSTPPHKVAADAAEPCFAVASSSVRPRRLDAVARSKLTRRGGPRTATHNAAQAERLGDGARSEHSEHAGHGSRRTRQGASMARSEVMERSGMTKRRRQATRIGDARRGSARRMSGCERRAAETGFPRCRKVQAWPRSAPRNRRLSVVSAAR